MAGTRRRGRLPLTELFRPLSDSASHFKKSPDGAIGKSSTLALFTGALLTGAAAGRATTPFRRVLDVELTAEGVGAIGGRAAEVAAATGVATGVVCFPLGPTVVHAVPVRGAAVT